MNIIMPEDEEQLALTLNGKKSNIRRKDFEKFAESCAIPVISANAMLNKLCSLRDDFLTQCDHAWLSDALKIKMRDLIVQRSGVIGHN